MTTFKYPVVSTILVTNSRVPIQLLRNYSRHLLVALVGNERIRLVPSIFCRFPLTPRPTYERVDIFFPSPFTLCLCSGHTNLIAFSTSRDQQASFLIIKMIRLKYSENVRFQEKEPVDRATDRKCEISFSLSHHKSFDNFIFQFNERKRIGTLEQ